MLRLDPELNADIIMELKKPLGKLYPNFEDAIDDIVSSEYFISVGDATFNNLIKYELYPNIGIIDNLIQRENHVHDIIPVDELLRAENPPGTITEDLWETIEHAIELSDDGDSHIILVEGEEDLAVLPCILLAPEETVILYGQPTEGLVLLNVSDLKDKAQELINGFTKE